jgi:hypothetical protein
LLCHQFCEKSIPFHVFYIVVVGCTQQFSWKGHNVTSQKATGSIPDEVVELFSIYVILPATLCIWDRLNLNINEYQKIFLGCKALPTYKANLTTICERTV